MGSKIAEVVHLLPFQQQHQHLVLNMVNKSNVTPQSPPEDEGLNSESLHSQDGGDGALLKILARTEPDKRSVVVMKFVASVICNVLELPQSQFLSMDCDKDFRYLGLDSLMLMEIRSQLEIALQHGEGNENLFPMQALQEYPTIRQLGQFITKQVCDKHNKNE